MTHWNIEPYSSYSEDKEETDFERQMDQAEEESDRRRDEELMNG
jgi:hypothetical protein